MAPIPPATETIYRYRDLPPSLLLPPAKPAIDPAQIQTDVDLMGITAQLNGALDACIDQVQAIATIYARASKPKPKENPDGE